MIETALIFCVSYVRLFRFNDRAKTSFDQIYDEHVFLFSALSVRNLANMHDLELVNVEHQITHGGSMRYTIAHKGAKTVSQDVINLIDKEKKSMNIKTFDVTYTAGRRKKTKDGYEAKKAKEVLLWHMN